MIALLGSCFAEKMRKQTRIGKNCLSVGIGLDSISPAPELALFLVSLFG